MQSKTTISFFSRGLLTLFCASVSVANLHAATVTSSAEDNTHFVARSKIELIGEFDVVEIGEGGSIFADNAAVNFMAVHSNLSLDAELFAGQIGTLLYAPESILVFHLKIEEDGSLGFNTLNVSKTKMVTDDFFTTMTGDKLREMDSGANADDFFGAKVVIEFDTGDADLQTIADSLNDFKISDLFNGTEVSFEQGSKNVSMTAVGNSKIEFVSNPDGSFKPALTVSTPEPATMILFALGAASLPFARRSRRK